MGVTFIFVMSKPCDSDVLVYVRFQSYGLNKAFFVILQAPLMLVFICYRYETAIDTADTGLCIGLGNLAMTGLAADTHVTVY